jgi:hypothetical protein
MAISIVQKASVAGHPQYEDSYPLFKKCRDCYLGEDRIKNEGEEYLPALPDQTASSYDVYRNRATFLNAFNRTISGLVGSVMRRPADIQVPDRMKGLLENINLDGYDIQTFIAHVIRETFISGRCGILVDREESSLPYLCIYTAENVVDWWLGKNRVPYSIALKEVVDQDPTDQVHNMVEQVRYLKIDEDGRYQVSVYQTHVEEFTQETQVLEVENYLPTKMGDSLNFIPFVLVNPGGAGWDVHYPPLLDLANLCLSHYRTSADLEAGRHYVSIPTPYIIGVDPEDFSQGVAIGPTTAIIIPNEQAKVGFLEFAGIGLKSLEEALTQKEHQMSVLGARVLERVRTGVESAEAARIHQSSELSILSTVVETVEKAVRDSLRIIAIWENLDPDEVSVRLNRDFVDARLPARDLQVLVDAYLKGAVSLDTLVYNLKSGEILDSKSSIEEEISRLSSSSESNNEESPDDMEEDPSSLDPNDPE